MGSLYHSILPCGPFPSLKLQSTIKPKNINLKNKNDEHPKSQRTPVFNLKCTNNAIFAKNQLFSLKKPIPVFRDAKFCVDINDFIIHSIIGTGSFGKVYLVQKKSNNLFYAMKTLAKEEVFTNNLKQYAITERNVLKEIDHPFIVKLRFSFQNPDFLFLVMDFMPGGDLGFYLERDHKFSERRAKFYACEIILAIAELHRHNIIFRDLKPDNVLLSEDGHVRLSDFGLSKENVHFSNIEKSFCGTFAYLAPEMLNKTGHGKAMDWYLVGALVFEMVTGIPPFYSDDQSQLFNNIKSAELEYPETISRDLKSLLARLLEKDPRQRIDLLEIKKHPWFHEVNWDDVLSKKLVPPKPHINPKLLNQIDKVASLFGQSRNTKLDIENWTFVEEFPI